MTTGAVKKEHRNGKAIRRYGAGDVFLVGAGGTEKKRTQLIVCGFVTFFSAYPVNVACVQAEVERRTGKRTSHFQEIIKGVKSSKGQRGRVSLMCAAADEFD